VLTLDGEPAGALTLGGEPAGVLTCEGEVVSSSGDSDGAGAVTLAGEHASRHEGEDEFCRRSDNNSDRREETSSNSDRIGAASGTPLLGEGCRGGNAVARRNVTGCSCSGNDEAC
jgi:hypothetical protein